MVVRTRGDPLMHCYVSRRVDKSNTLHGSPSRPLPSIGSARAPLEPIRRTLIPSEYLVVGNHGLRRRAGFGLCLGCPEYQMAAEQKASERPRSDDTKLIALCTDVARVDSAIIFDISAI